MPRDGRLLNRVGQRTPGDLSGEAIHCNPHKRPYIFRETPAPHPIRLQAGAHDEYFVTGRCYWAVLGR